MSIFFSPSTRGFYTTEIHGTAIPTDAQRITPARHEQLLKSQAAGAEIIPTPRGPVARFPKETLATTREAAIGAVKRQARARILAIAPYWRQLNDNAAIAWAAWHNEASADDHQRAAEAWVRRADIDAVRAASNRLETEIAAMSGEQLQVFDAADDAHWSDAHEG